MDRMGATDGLGRSQIVVGWAGGVTVPAIAATVFKFATEEVEFYGAAMSFGPTLALSALFFTVFAMPLILVLQRHSLLNVASLLGAGLVGGALTACALSLPQLPATNLVVIELAMGALAGSSFWLFSRIRPRFGTVKSRYRAPETDV